MIVTLTAATRPFYLVKVLESWSAARHIEAHSFIFNLEPTQQCQANQELIEQFTAPASKTVIVNEVKQGPLGNPWHSLERAFAANPLSPAILAEDDSTVSNDIFEFFEYTFDAYKDQKDILCVCAYNCNWQHWGDFSTDDLVISKHFSPTIWGIWPDRWKILRDMWDFDYSWHGWDWRIGDYVIPELGYSVVKPAHSRAQHIGKIGGAHCTEELWESTISPSFLPDRPFNSDWKVTVVSKG